MLMIDDYKVAYLHINKTAGTSIKEYLIELTKPSHYVQIGATHSPLESTARYMGKRFNDYTILTSVRNPFARLLSIYLYRRRRYKNGERSETTAQAHKLPFKKWFTNVVAKSSRFTDLSISSSILIDGQQPDNVYIITLESLNKDMAKFVKDVMGIDTKKKVPHVNRTDLIKGHYKKYYDKEMIDLVYEWDQWVIDNYYPWAVDKFF
jgi:hypothetical protein